MDAKLDSWFAREILVHEAALVRYLRRIWSNPSEIADLRQEIYLRVYEAAATARPQAPKSFLFATARHLMTDRIRRGRVVSIEATEDIEALNVLVDEISPERRASAWQELRRLAESLDRLPPKCREVMWMRKVQGLSQLEVAELMGITQSAVEKHIIKGVRLLSAVFYGGEGGADASGAPADVSIEAGYGHRAD